MNKSALKVYEQVSREKDDELFGISRMQDIYKKRGGKVDEPHRHDFYTILIIEKGSGKHLIDFHENTISGMEVFFIAPNQVHQLIEEEASIGYSLVFSGVFAQKHQITMSFLDELNLFREFGNAPSLKLNDGEMDQLKTYAEELLSIHQSQMVFKYDALASLVKLMLIRLKNLCSLPNDIQGEFTKSKATFRQFKSLLVKHFREEHSSAFYAAEMLISPDHLNRIVKQLTGKTTKEHIQSKLNTEAKRLLFFSEMSLKEIAFYLGFEEPAYFSQFFKKCNGISPSNFTGQHD